MNLAYVVKLGWREEFRFDNMLDAGDFASQAAAHRTADSDKDPISIKVVDLDDGEVDDD